MGAVLTYSRILLLVEGVGRRSRRKLDREKVALKASSKTAGLWIEKGRRKMPQMQKTQVADARWGKKKTRSMTVFSVPNVLSEVQEGGRGKGGCCCVV